MGEKVKRLAPTQEVVRELYLKSGNRCAYPGCPNVMIDEAGNFIGQICHIEAAEEGGERFNPNMTNEERRAFDNLMLMCYEHHVITNNVSEYPVSRLKRMKKDHEDKFSGVIQRMQNSVVDYGLSKSYQEAKTCQRFSDILEDGCSVKENLENAQVLNRLLYKMLDLPIETRHLLSIMVYRSYPDYMKNCCVPLNEIELATGKDAAYILQHIDILERRGLISEPDTNENNFFISYLQEDWETGWNYWNDIRDFCKRSQIPVEKICVELDFSVFD